MLVGGFDSMSRAPHAVQRSPERPDRSTSWSTTACTARSATSGMGELSDAENVRLEVTRAAQDMLALRSHERAAAATAEGRLADEIVPLPELAQDEGIRTDTSLERLAALQPAFGEDGTITAGNASQVSDGGRRGHRHDARARAGAGPRAAGRGRRPRDRRRPRLQPAPAPRRGGREAPRAPRPRARATSTCGRSTRPSPASCVASVAALGIDPERVNVNGGAVAHRPSPRRLRHAPRAHPRVRDARAAAPNWASPRSAAAAGRARRCFFAGSLSPRRKRRREETP